MGRYEVRLEAQDDSGHYRTTRLVAASKEAAQEQCERKELELCLFRIDDEKRLAKLSKAVEAADGDVRVLPRKDRAHYAIHHQTEPYVVVSVEEV